MPIIHDQFQAAERIEYMHLSPQAISRKVLFPFFQNEFLIHDGFEVGDILVLIKEAVNQLERRLQMISTPLHRLKCACFGRSLRLDPRENGVENAAVILWRLFSESYMKGLDDYREEVDNREDSKMTLEAYESDRSTYRDGGDNADETESDRSTHHDGGNNSEKIEAEDDTKECGEWQEFDCGLCLYTHHTAAPEETAFLYNEIFEHKIYLKNGIILKENDLVVDVGSNIGFFSVFSELEFPSPNALRFIAIEPMIENFNLLKKNLARYIPSAYIVQAAVGCVHSERNVIDDNFVIDNVMVKGDRSVNENNSKNKMHMTYFPHMPGNSCASIFVADKFNQHKRANLLTGMRNEICTLRSLSGIIDDSGFEVNDSQRISLLKVDVEGSELDVLLSIDDRHWCFIDQIVIETSRPNKRRPSSSCISSQFDPNSIDQSVNDNSFENVRALLKRKNFNIIVEHDPSMGVDTGCVLIFATNLSPRN
eukprot:CAMPEP_0119053250 /NCGR_PEP_ID=MMETSP1177-20130426/74313_1 /TAXON_ID=2985 /ORGANISM="Ochromonas sp, Strain CCMP1899" /LENGTH=480 /DNA_ID=CAMNT_0007033159 /DNA_START=1534 /DNA_END=2976 /DNA_ORIENTATION=-